MRPRIAWSTPAGELVAQVPDAAEIARHAEALATAYNHPHNAPLLGTTEPLSPDDVIAYYARMRDAGAPAFVFYVDGALAGDGDLRNQRGDAAELAFLVASPAAQGKGLGTRFATMLHAFAFTPAGLALERIYASIIPANIASRRVFEKLGYRVDAGPAARAFAEDPDDIVMVVERAAFVRDHAAAMADIRIAVR